MTDRPSNNILATCKQTRYHLVEQVRSSEVDVQGLSIQIVSSKSADSPKPAKGKAAAAGLDILVDTHLKLKGGTHYGLIGRNGVGKSTLLRALADKIIPGISYKTKIAVLQQTGVGDYAISGLKGGSRAEDVSSSLYEKKVLDYVLQSDDTKTEILRELKILNDGVTEDDDGSAQVKAYRELELSRLNEELAEQQKHVSLRSGARGSQARKELLKLESKVEEAKAKLEAGEIDVASESCQEELQNAVELRDSLQLDLESFNTGGLEKRAQEALAGLGFGEKMLEKRVKDLSGGWLMRCMLACALIQDADIMILDEPTNFLDLLGIIWLEKHLADIATESSKTVIIVSHDRDFIDNVSEEVIIMKDKSLSYFAGNLSAYEENQRSKRIHMTKMKDAQDRQVAHMEKTISANLKAGRKSGDDKRVKQAMSRQKRLDERTGMQVNASGNKFKLSRDMIGYHESRRQQIEIPPEERSTEIALPLAPDLRFPGALISLDNVSYRYSSKSPDILQDVNLSVHMGSKVGIIGLNGAGKSTMVKIMMGAANPTKGTVTKHPRLKTGYYSQHAVEDLKKYGHENPATTALALMGSEVEQEMDEGDIRGLLGSLGLSGRLASDVPIAKLSGGQLARLALARIMWRHPHLLILDEVTTHLDYYTVKGLCRALCEFNGAVVLITHDRFVMKYVIEGQKDLLDEEEEENSDEDNEGALAGAVYRLRLKELKRLDRGVQQFEDGVAKRVEKLRAQASK